MTALLLCLTKIQRYYGCNTLVCSDDAVMIHKGNPVWVCSCFLPAIQSGNKAKEWAQSRGHNERGYHTNHSTECQTPLAFHHLYLSCNRAQFRIKKKNCKFLKKLITYGLFNFTLKCTSRVLRYHIFLWYQNFTIIMAVRFFISSSWKELCHSSSNDSPTTPGVHNTTGSLLLMVWWDRPIKIEP